MEDTLTKQDKIFVKEVVATGNQTKAAKIAYGIKDSNYAGVKATKKIRKDKIKNAIKSIADSISDQDLIRVHKQGLKATKKEQKIIGRDDDGKPEYEMIDVEDYGVRHKYLDSAYKIKGIYAPEKTINLNVEAEEEELREIIKSIRG